MNPFTSYLCKLIVGFSVLYASAPVAVAQEVFNPLPSTPPPVLAPKAASIYDGLVTRPLVRAVVEQRDREVAGRITSHQRIEHVFCGPAELLGQTFTDSSVGPSFSGASRGGWYLVQPALKVGETGIWMLIRLDDKWVRESGQSSGLQWPARSDGSARYSSFEKLAEAIENVWRAPDEVRMGLVRELIASNVDEIATWAIRLLAEVSPSELRAAAPSLIRSARPEIVVVFDRAMWEADREGWASSSDLRRELLDRLSKAAVENGDNALLLLARLDALVQNKQILPNDALARVTPFVQDATQTTAVRQRAILVLTRIAKEPKVQATAFELASSILEGDDDDTLRLAAAHAIQQVEGLNAEQFARLIVLRDRYAALAAQTDQARAPVKQVASLLQEAVREISKAKPPTDGGV